MVPACAPPRAASRPKVLPPANACCTHAHVFGPAAQFPYAADRSYTPPDAPLRDVPVDARHAGPRRAACWCRAAPTVATMRRCWTRWSVIPTGCAASRLPMRMWRRMSCGAGRGLGVRGLRFNHFFRGGNAALSRRRAARCGAHAGAGHGRARLAPAAVDRREGPARYPANLAGAGASGGDRSHGPHGCGRRHRHRRLPVPAALARRGRMLGEALRRPPPQPQVAGLSRCAPVPRGPGARQPGAAHVGQRLAAPAHGGRDARRRAPARPAPRLDAGRGGAARASS